GIAHSLGLALAEIDAIRLAAGLHDIGKVGIPLAITAKAERLSLPELRLLQTHPLAGQEILDGIDFGGPVALLVRQHHERLDGSGYPDGLTGAAILPGAKIIAVADVLDAMLTDRSYRPAPGLEAATLELRQGRGLLFEAAVVDACLSLCDDPAVLAALAAGTPARSHAPAEAAPARPPQLTLQQNAVMYLLAEGRSTKEIARAMGLGLGTVKTHLSRAYATLGANNRVSALRAAGLLEPGGR
ncbi:MAG: HD domain-containing phosphohydrolase, partial [Acetobacteraceae bacterium]